jgi:hypothetical protein
MRVFLQPVQSCRECTRGIPGFSPEGGAALNTLGDGFVEAIDDTTLETIAQNQPSASDGRIHGEAVQVPIFEAPGQTRVGRFGWKDQHGSLLSFIADAYEWASPTDCALKTPPRSARSRRILRMFRTIWDSRTSIISRNSFAAQGAAP